MLAPWGGAGAGRLHRSPFHRRIALPDDVPALQDSLRVTNIAFPVLGALGRNPWQLHGRKLGWGGALASGDLGR
eukprot:3878703-Pyramimonas_sp.AAC.2